MKQSRKSPAPGIMVISYHLQPRKARGKYQAAKANAPITELPSNQPKSFLREWQTREAAWMMRMIAALLRRLQSENLNQTRPRIFTIG
jgi:hypothetical protein